MAYNGTVELAAGVTPKNNNNFPLVHAHDVYVSDDLRLDEALSSSGMFTYGYYHNGCFYRNYRKEQPTDESAEPIEIFENPLNHDTNKIYFDLVSYLFYSCQEENENNLTSYSYQQLIPSGLNQQTVDSTDAEAWATGKRNNEYVGPEDETYHNNAAYYADSALSAEQWAQDARDLAFDHAEAAEAWATGKILNVDVGPEHRTYHNNAEYYAQQAALEVEKWKEVIQRIFGDSLLDMFILDTSTLF